MSGAALFDAVVVGGGPAGAVAAITLARANKRVALLEASSYEAPRVGEHLGPGSRELIDEFAREGFVDEFSASPGIRLLWGDARERTRDYLFAPGSGGWNLDRRRFDQGLFEAALSAGVLGQVGERVRHIDRDAGLWSVRTARRELVCRGLIDASGAASPLARPLGARRQRADRLIGLARWAKGVSEDRSLLTETVRSGWWYSAQLTADRFVAVFMTDADLISRGASHEAIWTEALALAPATAQRVAAHVDLTPAVVSLATTAMLVPAAAPGWIAVGDAAMAIDPLSGQGIVRAIRSGHSGAQALISWLEGDHDALDSYAASIASSFDQALAARSLMYRQEQRWPDSVFWRRRQFGDDAVRLDPFDRLVSRADRSAAAADCEPSDRALTDACRTPAPAHDVIRRVMAGTGLPDDVLVQRVQRLLARGVIELGPPHPAR